MHPIQQLMKARLTEAGPFEGLGELSHFLHDSGIQRFAVLKSAVEECIVVDNRFRLYADGRVVDMPRRHRKLSFNGIHLHKRVRSQYVNQSR